jgi:hypothetical protein
MRIESIAFVHGNWRQLQLPESLTYYRRAAFLLAAGILKYINLIAEDWRYTCQERSPLFIIVSAINAILSSSYAQSSSSI